MLAAIFGAVAPVFLIALVGYVWRRAGPRPISSR
jgi:predicted permease